MLACIAAFDGGAQEERDPAAWGEDHVGGKFPLYMTGDECLFCHRVEVGTDWQANRHNAGMRIKDLVSPTLLNVLSEYPDLLSEMQYTIGGEELVRLLRPNGKYGQFAMHGARIQPPSDNDAEWHVTGADAEWDDDIFAKKCAGCHTTAVETEYAGFSAPSLDCFVCHGDIPDGHQNRPELALFSKTRRKVPVVEASACGQCHLRGGTSKSTGLPYPNQFIPGDNLFRDYQVDLSEGHIAKLEPLERHIFQNVRDVAVLAKEAMSCTTCHDIHGASSARHRELDWTASATYCAICHDNKDDLASIVRFERHSDVCDY